MDATEVREYFERVVKDWDEMRLAWYDERVIDELAAHSHLTDSSVVLDVGTCTGFVAAGLAPRVETIAIDHAPAILEVARANLAQLAITNVEFRQADLGSIPLDDDTADASVVNMVLHHAEDPAAMLTEMARVTKPGGWVAVADEVEHRHELMRTEHADIWLGFSADT